jgi:hypothetical protein
MKHVFEDGVGGGRSPTDVKSLGERIEFASGIPLAYWRSITQQRSLEDQIKLLEAQLAKAQAECDCLREMVRSKFVEKLDRVMYSGEG